MSKLIFTILLIALKQCGAKEIGAVFSPKWHRVNDFDLEGQTCAIRLPAVKLPCPSFGVLATDTTTGKALSQNAIENTCIGAGFPACGAAQSLFPDGSCANCTAGFTPQGDGTGDLWCENSTTGEKKLFENPFSCLKKTKYRPCHPGPVLGSATVSHYYKGDDLANQMTMQSCANQMGLAGEGTEVLLVGEVKRKYSFPLIANHDDQSSRGYLQCPNAAPEKYDFAGAVWLAYYIIWSAGVLYIGSFTGFKLLRQKNVVVLKRPSSPAGSTSQTSTIEMSFVSKPKDLKRVDTASTHEDSAPSHVEVEEQSYTQVGYSDSLIGRVGYYFVIILTLSLVIWIILSILDVYGLLWHQCSASVRKACIGLGNDAYKWRTGYGCGAGCFFGSMWTTGKMLTWPYYKFRGGGGQNNVIFIISWHFTVLWLWVLLAVQTHLRTFFRIMCPLKYATTVEMSRPREAEIQVATDVNSWEVKLLRSINNFRVKLFGPPMSTYTCKVQSDSFGVRYFDFQCTRYSWVENLGGFFISSVTVGDGTQAGLKALEGGLTEPAATRRLEQIGLNAIHVPMPSIFQAFAEEYFGAFYLYQFSCLAVWYSFWYFPMAITLTVVVFTAGIINIRSKRQNQRKVKIISEISSQVSVLRGGEWQTMKSDNLAPGDVIAINTGDVIAADCVLLSGRCVIDESSLTGEPMPVPKIAVENSSRKYDGGQADMKFSLLCGTTVESTSPGHSGLTLALVMLTGSRTGKGSIVKCILHPAPLTFKFDIHWRVVFGFLILWGIIIFGVCYYMIDGHISSWYYGIFTISQICSPLIPTSFVISRAEGANRLRKKHQVFCVNIDRVAVAGKVRIFCFDKTGTLTNSGLDLVGVDAATPSRDDPETPVFGGIVSNEDIPSRMSDIIACCHEIDAIPVADTETIEDGRGAVINGMRLCGNEVDRKMFQSSAFVISELSSQPVMFSEIRNRKLRVLRRFEFDRETMTMSVIVEEVGTPEKERYVFTKGSHEAVESKTLPSTLPQNFDRRATFLASEGYYVLAVASKRYDGPDDVALAERRLMETDLCFAGFVVFENRLKPDTTSVIEALRAGATRTVMVTGDNAQTAMKVAKDCTLSTAKRFVMGDVVDNEILWTDAVTGQVVSSIDALLPELKDESTELVVTGNAFNELCALSRGHTDSFGDVALNEEHASRMQELIPYTRIFARMKPDQKVDAVRMHMTLGITGMCGDGANDAGALRMAHVGLALASGAGDATIVAPFSTPHESLQAVVALLREGRTALANALAAYKFLLMYGETMVLVSVTAYYMNIIIPEPFWILIDSFVNLGFGWAIMQAKSRSVLAPNRPTCKLIGIEVFTSVTSQVLLNFIVVIIGIGMLFRQDFFVCKEFDPNLVSPERWWLKGDNYESVVIGLLAMAQFINSAAIFNLGFEYRQKWFRNLWLCFFWILGAALTLFLVFSGPSFLSCFFRINCGDTSLLEKWGSLGKINYSGTIYTAPKGCPCYDQVAPSGTCESEYINCEADKYNQTYHHNITPLSFRWILFALIVANCIIGYVIEGFFIYGPVRQWLRRRRAKRLERKNVFSRAQTSSKSNTSSTQLTVAP